MFYLQLSVDISSCSCPIAVLFNVLLCPSLYNITYPNFDVGSSGLQPVAFTRRNCSGPGRSKLGAALKTIFNLKNKFIFLRYFMTFV